MKIILAISLLLIASRSHSGPLCVKGTGIAGCDDGGGGSGATGATGPTGATGGGGVISGSDKQIVFIDSTTPTGATGATYNKTTDQLKAINVDRGGAFIDVRTFGATGDCSTDDTTAIQAANTAAAGLKRVFFPCAPGGCYKITAPLTLDYSNTNWFGEGQCSTIRQFTTSADGITHGTITSTIYDLVLQDLRIDCDASATSCGVGFNFESISDSDFRNIYVDVFPSGTAGFTTGLRIHSTSNEATRNLFFDLGVRTFAGSGSIGIALTGTGIYGANSTRFYGGHVRADSGTGISIANKTDQSVVSGVVFEGSTNQAYKLTSTGISHLVTGCRFEGVTNGVLFDTGSAMSMSIGNLFSSGLTTKVTDNGSRNFVIEPQAFDAGGAPGFGNSITMSNGDVFTKNGAIIAAGGGSGSGHLFQARSNVSTCTSGNWFVKGNGAWGMGDCHGSEDVQFQQSGTGVMQLQVGKFAANNGFYTGSTGSTPRLASGTASPEGVVTGAVGSIFQGDGNSGAAPVWFKTGGAGNTGWTAASTVAPAGATDILLTSQPTAPFWQISGLSKNQLYGINKRSDITITGNTGTISIANPSAPFSGEEDGAQSPIVITTAATDTAILEVSVSPRNTTCVGVGNPDACCTSGTGNGTCNLPTDHLSLIAGFFVTAQFYGIGFAYPQSITVEGQYDDGAGATTWRTIASTTTNTSNFFRANATNPSTTSPHKIYALRWTFTNWSATGTTYLITAGMHHRSETPFPGYLRRDGDVTAPMLGSVTFGRYLGAINHIVGPPDQPLKIAGGTGQKALISGSEPCRDLVTNTTTVGNVLTGEDDLMTYTIPAATLGSDGNRVSFTMSGTAANTVNTKQIKLKFGGTTILDTAALIPISAALSYSISGECIRTGATTQKCSATFSSSAATFVSTAAYVTAAETLSGTVVLKLTGTATATDDIKEETSHVTYCPGA